MVTERPLPTTEELKVPMHVMIATDGSLEPEATAALATRLAGPDGRITVVSVVEVPRQILDELRAAATPHVDTGDVEYRHIPAADTPVATWVGDDAFVENYVNRVVLTRTAELVAELERSRTAVEVAGIEGESAARSVLDAVKTEQPDVLVLGTHGSGRFEGLLGSLSTKLARLAPCPVLLVR